MTSVSSLNKSGLRSNLCCCSYQRIPKNLFWNNEAVTPQLQCSRSFHWCENRANRVLLLRFFNTNR